MEHGTGAIPTPQAVRNTQFRILAAAPIVDWSIPYTVPLNAPVLNQDGSSGCTSFGTSIYVRALSQSEGRDDDYSRRYIYSQVFQPNGGAYIDSAMAIPLKGVPLASQVPDMDASEAIMRDSSLNATATLVERTSKYAIIPKSNIDQLAQVIKDYNGFVTGFLGHNGMFAPDGTIADWSKVDWGHAVYVYGFEIRNGVKCLRFRNSWGNAWGSSGDGFFPEEFVNAGDKLFSCYTYTDVEDIDPTSMNNRYVMVDKDVWLVKNGQRSLIYNTDAFMAVCGDWSKIEKISQSQLDAIPDSGKIIAGINQE